MTDFHNVLNIQPGADIMNASERKRKFNEFLRITQEGILTPSEIVRKLGISINTLYNWRKRLHTETDPIQKQVSPVLPEPLFSRVAIEPERHPAIAPSFIEITIGNILVLRVPPQSSSDVLHTILDHYSILGK